MELQYFSQRFTAEDPEDRDMLARRKAAKRHPVGLLPVSLHLHWPFTR
jgi:hypothetical protein